MWLQKSRLGRFLADIPNERSSHERAVPRAGGALFGVSFAVGSLIAIDQSELPLLPALTVVFSVLVIGMIGFLDDIKSLSAKLRLAIQAMVAAACIYALAFPTLEVFLVGPQLLIVFLLLICFTVSSINFFNFADGINGYVSLSSAVVITFVFSAGLVWQDNNVLKELKMWDHATACMLGSLLGFLYHNLLTGKVFMGDTGSTVLGLIHSMLMLDFLKVSLKAQVHTNPWYVGLTVVGIWVFVVFWIYTDCASMVFAKALRGITLSLPHKEHVFQKLNQNVFNNHFHTTLFLCVTQAAMGVGVLYMFFSVRLTVGLLTMSTVLLVVVVALTIYHYRSLKTLKQRLDQKKTVIGPEAMTSLSIETR